MDRVTEGWIDGIGDEIMLFISTVLGLLLPLYFLWMRLRRRPGNEAPLPDETENGIVPPAVYNNGGECPICLAPHMCPLETNCGHIFCGLCLKQCYEHQPLYCMVCPLCRSSVTLLFICFSVDPQAPLPLLNKQREAASFAHMYNRRNSAFPLSFLQMIRDWPTTMRHFWHDLSVVGMVTFLARARMVFYIMATTLYIWSPLDMFPEALLGLVGYLDDLLILAVLALHVSVMYRRIVVDEGVDEGDDAF